MNDLLAHGFTETDIADMASVNYEALPFPKLLGEILAFNGINSFEKLIELALANANIVRSQDYLKSLTVEEVFIPDTCGFYHTMIKTTLKLHDIKTIAEIVSLKKSEFTAKKRVGWSTCYRIERVLGDMGLSFTPEAPAPY